MTPNKYMTCKRVLRFDDGNSWISDVLTSSSSRRRRKDDGRGEGGEWREK